MPVPAKVGVQSFVQNGLGHHQGFWCQPQVLGREDGNGRHFAHLGPEPIVAPPPALHCARGRHYQIG